jgi:hypothetical protein
LQHIHQRLKQVLHQSLGERLVVVHGDEGEVDIGAGGKLGASVAACGEDDEGMVGYQGHLLGCLLIRRAIKRLQSCVDKSCIVAGEAVGFLPPTRGTCRRGGKLEWWPAHKLRGASAGHPEAFDEARPLRYQPRADRFDRFRRHFYCRFRLHMQNCTPKPAREDSGLNKYTGEGSLGSPPPLASER